jgi:haloalkane dehalogenase
MEKEMNLTPLEDGRIHSISIGHGRPLLFVHGTPTSHVDWLQVMPRLAAGRSCIAIDHLGFGQSDRPAQADYSPVAHARRLAAWLEKQGLDDFDLVAHDFGGPIALSLLSNPKFRIGKIVLMNTWMWPLTEHSELRGAIGLAAGPVGHWLYRHLNFSPRFLMPMAYGDRKKLDRSMHREAMNAFAAKDDRERVLWALAKSLRDESVFYQDLWSQRIALLQHPVLLAWGLKDRALAPAVLHRWREISQGKSDPRNQGQGLEIRTYADAGHWPQIEAAVRVAEDMGSFLGG